MKKCVVLSELRKVVILTPRRSRVVQKMRVYVYKNVTKGWALKKMGAKTIPFMVKGYEKVTFFGVTVGQYVGDRGEKKWGKEGK